MASEPPPPPDLPGPRRRLPAPILEALGYGGAAAALAGVAISLEASDAEPALRALAGLVAAAALIAAGWFAGRDDREEMGRMRAVLWFLGLVSWFHAAGIVVGPDALDLDGKWAVVAAGAFTAALAVPLWLLERRSLQLIGAFSSLLLAFGALVSGTKEVGPFGIGPEVPDLLWSALVAVGFGSAAMFLGLRDVLVPRRTAMVLGALSFLIGVPLVFTDAVDLVVSRGVPDLTLLLTGAAAVLVLFVGSWGRVVAVTGLGVVWLLGSVAGLVGNNVDETAPAAVVGLLGFGLLAATVALARSRSS